MFDRLATRLPILAALALVLTATVPTAVTPALANYSCEPGQPNCVPMGGPNTAPTPTPWPEIACRVKGPKDTNSDDLRFTNVGDVEIEQGTKVYWQFKQTGEHGSFTLVRDLPVGADIDDDTALKISLPGKTPCLSRLS